jgi:altronate dehydratase
MNVDRPVLTEDAVANLLVDTEPYLSCDECFERIDRYVEQRLRDVSHHDVEDVAMETHLAGCGVCAEEARTLEELLRQDAEQPHATPHETT